MEYEDEGNGDGCCVCHISDSDRGKLLDIKDKNGNVMKDENGKVLQKQGPKPNRGVFMLYTPTSLQSYCCSAIECLEAMKTFLWEHPMGFEVEKHSYLFITYNGVHYKVPTDKRVFKGITKRLQAMLDGTYEDKFGREWRVNKL